MESATTGDIDSAKAAFKLAGEHYQRGAYAAAIADYQRAHEALPSWYQPLYHAAVCLQLLRRYPEALRAYRHAIARNPDVADCRYHHAKALKDSGHLDEALPEYAAALALDPNSPEIRYSLGLLHLLQGNWLPGWAGYELRLEGSDRANKEHRPATCLTLWSGEAVPDEAGLIVYSEQGMGDVIQCWRYASALRQVFGRIKFAAHAPLVGLLQANAPPAVEVVTRIAPVIDESGFTHYVNLMSLPACFRTVPQNVPYRDASYLTADPAHAAGWAQRLAADKRPKVGVVWQGGQLTHAPGRDIALEYLAPLFERQDICWISLTRDCRAPADTPVIDWMPEVTDMAQTAALIANLDLVIAVDTAVAHLAGALGKPVWLLNRFESEWRWMHGQTTTPWYATMRLFNQATPDTWTDVVQQLSLSLNELFPINFHQHVRQQLYNQLADESGTPSVQLNNALRLLSKWRSALIQNTVLRQHGTVVWQGPLQGLDFLPQSAEGCHVAKLLGCYEQPLLPLIEQAIQTQYPTILNIGCAEGYYAVGMARRMPNSRVLAFDVNPNAQATCRALAEKNGVADRIEIGALFRSEDFAAFAARKVLVLCDIEGAENDLLDPEKAPALKGMDLIVESHECSVPGITQVLIERFKGSHQITLVQDDGQRQLQNAPAWFSNLAHLDQLLATWEWRSGPTPWLVMRANVKRLYDGGLHPQS